MPYTKSFQFEEQLFIVLDVRPLAFYEELVDDTRNRIPILGVGVVVRCELWSIGTKRDSVHRQSFHSGCVNCVNLSGC